MFVDLICVYVFVLCLFEFFSVVLLALIRQFLHEHLFHLKMLMQVQKDIP